MSFPDHPRMRPTQANQMDDRTRLTVFNPNDDDTDARRTSGAAALGLLMSGDMDDGSDSDEDDDNAHHQSPPPRYNSPPGGLVAHRDDKKAIATGFGFGGDEKISFDDDDDEKRSHGGGIPLAAPKPGYVAPVTQFSLSHPVPAATPSGRQPDMRQTEPLRVNNNTNPFMQMPASPAPTMPHPLPQMTPITPVFARPAKSPGLDKEGVKFSNSRPIMRGNTEETLLPKRGERGDDFWRRFSMVVKEDVHNKGKKSHWLKETQNGTARLSRWVWVIGMVLLIAIAGGIGLGWWISRNSTTHNAPKAVGGSAGEVSDPSSTSHAGTGTAVAAGTSSSPHVSPTFTVARREAYADPVPTFLAGMAGHKRMGQSRANL